MSEGMFCIGKVCVSFTLGGRGGGTLGLMVEVELLL